MGSWREDVEGGGRRVNLPRKRRGNNRKEQDIITRFTIGNSALNRTLYNWGERPTGLCDFCQKLKEKKGTWMRKETIRTAEQK